MCGVTRLGVELAPHLPISDGMRSRAGHGAPSSRLQTSETASGRDDGDRNGCERCGAGCAGEARAVGGGRQGRTGLTPRCPQEEEFRWLLNAEVHAVLKQLQDILKVSAGHGRPAIPLSTGPAAEASERRGVQVPTLSEELQSRRRQGDMCEYVCAARY